MAKLSEITRDIDSRVRLFRNVTGLTGGGATNLDGVATRATGTITFSVNPSASQTITLNGSVWTFVASGASGNQTNIAGSLAATLTQLATDLNASADTQVVKCRYSVSTTVLTVAYRNGDFTANAFLLAASNATPGAPNLVGGMDYGDANQGGVFCALVVSNQLSFYRLRSGTDAESSPTLIRPDDYDGTYHQRVWQLQNIGGAAGSFLPLTGGSLTGAVNWAKGADIASAATTNIGAATGNFVHITGTTTITAFDTIQAGTVRILKFDGALTLTHNATTLILPGGASITTAAGDMAIFVSEGSGNWRCAVYSFAANKYLLLSGGTLTGGLTGTTGAFSGNVSALNFTPGAAAHTFGATPTWDFDAAETEDMTVTADITSMTTSNRAAGKRKTVFFTADSSAHATAVNGSWIPITAIDATLPANKHGVLVLECRGTTEASVWYSWKKEA